MLRRRTSQRPKIEPAKIEKPKPIQLPKTCPNCGAPLTPYTVEMPGVGVFQKVYCPKGDFGTEIQVK